MDFDTLDRQMRSFEQSLDRTAAQMRFWKWASANFQDVLLVPGNHEYYGGHRLTVERYNEMHRFCLDFIKKRVAESTADKIVVVTHHLPTRLVVAAEHKGLRINSAFSTELDDFIADSRINAWIYGHSHTNIDTVIGKTKIVSNQMGYTFRNEHLHNGFEAGKYIEI